MKVREPHVRGITLAISGALLGVHALEDGGETVAYGVATASYAVGTIIAALMLGALGQ